MPVKDALGFGHVLPTCPGRTEVPRTLPLAPQPRASSRHEGSGDSLAPCRLAPCTPGMPGPAPQGHVSCVGEAWHCRGSAGDPGVWRSRAGQPSSYAEKLEAGKQRATWRGLPPSPRPASPLLPGAQVLGQTASQVGVSGPANAGLGKANTAGHGGARLPTCRTALSGAQGGLVSSRWGPSG